MGLGINLARESAPEHAEAMDNLKEQLLLVLINRLGGKIYVPVKEIDDARQFILYMSLDPESRVFSFDLQKKN